MATPKRPANRRAQLREELRDVELMLKKVEES
jgi:hypothetical protein